MKGTELKDEKTNFLADKIGNSIEQFFLEKENVNLT